MKCDYCGRTNTNDGHGGCFSCGAPIHYTVNKYSHQRDTSLMYATACTMMTYSARTNTDWNSER